MLQNVLSALAASAIWIGSTSAVPIWYVGLGLATIFMLFLVTNPNYCDGIGYSSPTGLRAPALWALYLIAAALCPLMFPGCLYYLIKGMGKGN